jgi:Glycosyl hydrolase family 20, domain 2
VSHVEVALSKYNRESGSTGQLLHIGIMDKGMKKRLVAVVGTALIWAPMMLGLDTPVHARLFKLEPAPKEVQMRTGGFQVGPQTKIFVQFGHQSEDRIAAETLAEEVESQAGLKLDIFGMKSAAKAEGGSIVLARLQDARVRKFLAQNGLKADEAVGQQGYLLFSDDSHLIVAANSGEGLFYGVQTLRQLLRPQGNGLICPGVGIRDWPGLQNNVPASLSQLSAPHFLSGR